MYDVQKNNHNKELSNNDMKTLYALFALFTSIFLKHTNTRTNTHTETDTHVFLVDCDQLVNVLMFSR